MYNLKSWQVIVLILVIVALGSGGYFIYRWSTNGMAKITANDNTELVAVTESTLTNTVSSSGNLIYSVDKGLTFGSAGTVGAVAVLAGDRVSSGQVLASLDDASLIPLQKAIVQAQISLTAAQAALDSYKSPYKSADFAQAEANVLSAQLALNAAQDNLTKLQNPYTASQILNAQIAVFNATTALATVQSNYDAAKVNYDKNPTWPDWVNDYQIKTYQLFQAKNALADAQTNLANMTTAPDPLQVELKTKQITIAENNLTAAKDKLTEMQGAPDPLQIKLKELDITAAQANLDKAEKTLTDATLVSPIEGLVIAVNMKSGDAVAANTVVVEVVDPKVMAINAVLDEVDVPSVRIGQKARITFSSLSDTTLTGTVATISATGRSQSGVVTYSVNINITIPDQLTLLAGMTATADIITQQASNVLVVPDAAISGTTAKPTVQISNNGLVQTRSITTGISDGSYTEVKTGLQLGEYVVVQLPTTSKTSTTNTIRGRNGFQGFPGGGGAVINIIPGN